METITFCFNHPVAVKVFFICTSNPNIHQIRHFRSDENGSLSIPLEGIESGTWRLMLEWSYDGRDFSLEKRIVIPKDN